MSVRNVTKRRLVFNSSGQYMGLYSIGACSICGGPAFKGLQLWPFHQSEFACFLGTHPGRAFRIGIVGHGPMWADRLEALKSLYKVEKES